MEKTKVQIAEYKGQPIFQIETGEWDGKPQYFSFGLKKAKLILENLNAIRDFVNMEKAIKKFGIQDEKSNGDHVSKKPKKLRRY